MATTTETDTDADTRERVERNNWRTRWLHAGVYTLTLLLLATGLWLLSGREVLPGFLSRYTDAPTAHTWMGWGLTGVTGLGVVLGWRAVATFIVGTVRFQRGDLRWFLRWPAAVFTGRFARHDGHFDPGQRIMNMILVILLGTLIGTGIGLTASPIGLAFVWLNRVHTWATYVFIPVIAGHILVAAGVLPGYRGVWRAMHLGGRLPIEVARRVWPGWTSRTRTRTR